MTIDMLAGIRPRRTSLHSAAVCLALLLTVAGCAPAGKSAGDAAGVLTVPGAVTQETPEAAARSLLEHLQVACAAAGRQDAAAENAAIDHALPLYAAVPLTARATVLAHALIGGDLDRSVLKLWARGVAYYAPGFALDSVRRVSGAAASERVVVGARATHGSEPSVILLTCVRGEDQLWRVVRVEFAGRDAQAAFLRASSQPPASASAPAAEGEPEKP